MFKIKESTYGIRSIILHIQQSVRHSVYIVTFVQMDKFILAVAGLLGHEHLFLKSTIVLPPLQVRSFQILVKRLDFS